MASKRSVKRWFLDEVFYRRCAYCVLWASIIQVFTCFFITTLLQANVIYIHLWIKDATSAVLSTTGLIQVFVVSLTVASTVLIHANFFKMSADVNATRASLLWRVLQPRNALVIIFYAVSAAVMVRVLVGASWGDFRYLSGPCRSDSNVFCVNLRHQIVVLNGGFVGLLFGIHYCVSDYRHVTFPVLQQAKFVQIKHSVRRKFMESAAIALSYVKWFAVAYCILGVGITTRVANLLKVQTNEAVTLWSTIYSLADVGVWWVMMLTSSAIVFLYRETIHIFQIFQTEAIAFQIETPFTGPNCETLAQAMACSEFPLLQYLSYFDLTILSQYPCARRKEIFSLSQPGGHPHIWNEISTQCLALVKNLNDTLTNPLSEQSPKHDKADELARSKLSAVWSPGNSGIFPNSRIDTTNLHPKVEVSPSPIREVALYFLRMRKECATVLLNIQPIGYFFKEKPDFRNRVALADCQPHIWALEGLTFLIVSSYREDKYGVVQTNLQDILAAMLDLKHTLDQKSDTLGLRRVSKDSTTLPQDVRLRCALKNCLTTSLYTISVTFGNNLRALPLSAVHSARLSRYLELKA